MAYAVISNNLTAAKYLLANGADPDFPNFNQEAPLHLSSSQELTLLLLKYSANPNALDKEGETPLSYAARSGSTSALRTLLEYAANPNSKSFTLKQTPLHCAITGNHLDCVSLLLKYNADAYTQDLNGNSPLNLASPECDSAIKRSVQTNYTEENFSEEARTLETNSDTLKSVIGSDCKKNELHSLYIFLSEINIQQYFHILIKAGYDDLCSMVEQMTTPFPLDETMLSEIGISKPGHRKRLLVKLYKLAFPEAKPMNHLLFSCCAQQRPFVRLPVITANTLFAWLNELRLGKLHELFIGSGYDDLSYIREQMVSPYPITEETLKTEVKLNKPGHRLRILGKLLDEARLSDLSIYSTPNCAVCALL